MLKEVALALILVGLSSGGPLSRLETAKPRADNTEYRLPKDIVPEHYILKLTPDIPNEKFEGSVTIVIRVVKATDTIVLHKRQLTIPNAKTTIIVTDPEGGPIAVKDISETEIAKEFFKIILDQELVKDSVYTVEIPKFEGTLNDENEGFYLAKYKEGDKEKIFATTQFEPTGARRAFPCFDEPALKATFKITIVTPKDYNSVSNMKIHSKKPINKKVEYEFEETVKMSTYLIAFIVSEMTLSDDKELHRVLAKKKDLDAGKAKFALTTGAAVLEKIEDFVSIPYSINKMDQAAIPDQYFSAGAMENWGLVTYRESYLLYSTKTTPTRRLQSIATIIAHEFGHQWFGNLVTPEWWEYIWLNEGFATYFEHLAAAEAKPDWKIMDQFVVENTQYVFGPDSLEDTRPMNMDAGSPYEIRALFDRIAYEKSGSVIRMMEKFLTTDIFKKGLTKYLSENQFGTVTPAKLYKAMQDTVTENNAQLLPDGLTVDSIMTTWDSNAGFPVVTVERKYDTKENNVVLKQSQFLLMKIEDDAEKKWTIPINYARKSNSRFTENGAEKWLKEKEETVTVTELDATDWLIVNKQQTGYYRVNYDETNWNLIIDALIEDHTKIDALNRAQLIDDSFNLAKSKRLEYDIPLKLSSYLVNETEYIPLYPFFTEMSFLNGMITGTPIQNAFHNHIKKLLSGVYKHIGFEQKGTDSHLNKLNRIPVLTWLCNLGDADCRTKSLKKVNRWTENSETIPLNLQAPIFCGAMRGATKGEWSTLFKKYEQTTDDAQLRSRMLDGLACSENTAILNRFLDTILTGEDLMKKLVEIASICNAGSVGVKTTFDYVNEKFTEIHTILNDYLAVVLIKIGSKLTTQAQVDELKALSEKHTQQNDLFRGAIEIAEANVQWNTDNLQSITNFFSKDDDDDDGGGGDDDDDGGDDDGGDGGSISVTSSLAVTAVSLIMCLLFK